MAQRDPGDEGAGRPEGAPGAARGVLIAHPGRDRERDPEALRGDLSASREALGETLNAAQDDFEHHSGLAALQRLQARVEQVRFEATEALERARLSTRNSGEALGTWVQERPVEVLAVAFGVGFILGSRPFK